MDSLKAIVIYIVAAIAALALLLWLCPANAHSRPAKRVKATAVHCTDNCEPCKALIAELTRQGVALSYEVSGNHTQPVPWFPAVDYSDGVVDWGQRIFGQACDYAQPLPVVKHKQEE